MMGDVTEVALEANEAVPMRAVAVSSIALMASSYMMGSLVWGADTSRGVTFERDIEPILTRAGCNAGACHGKASGQNGFKLSLLGFDPEFDHVAISREAGGRRVLTAIPEKSLLLQKATAAIPHGGGRRFDPAGPFYETFRHWIAAGLPRAALNDPKLQRVTVEPVERRLRQDESFRLRATAHFTDGSLEDVTHLAAFGSSESTLVAVDSSGLVTAGRFAGEATISARYEGIFANCDVAIPLSTELSDYACNPIPRSNFIDDHVWNKLKKLGLFPSGPAPDAKFLRRAFLDAIGRLPTPSEAREFLGDSSLDKRPRLIDRLLDRPEYADHWANKWMDLLRPNPYRVGIKAVFNLDAWIRSAFRTNMPYDQFVREIMTARGSTFEEGPSTIFRDRREPIEIAPVVSQLFLGIRLECAKCHHHPFESWGQEQFYEFAAYFARVGRKGTGLSPPISGGEEIVFTRQKRFGEAPAHGQGPHAQTALWFSTGRRRP